MVREAQAREETKPLPVGAAVEEVERRISSFGRFLGEQILPDGQVHRPRTVRGGRWNDPRRGEGEATIDGGEAVVPRVRAADVEAAGKAADTVLNLQLARPGPAVADLVEAARG